jgi:hypothetical protein
LLTRPQITAEHILELQTLSRFMTAILDGQFPPILSAGLPGASLKKIDFHAVQVFSSVFQLEDAELAVPSNEVLAYFGSVSYSGGMVVADSFLNAVKSQVRRLHQLEGLDLGS